MEVRIKARMNIMLVAILVMVAEMISIMVRGPKTMVGAASTPSVAPAPAIQIPPHDRAMPRQSPVLAKQTLPSVPEKQVDATKVFKSRGNETLEYTAMEGDTLSDVVAGLLGYDSKKNRDAVIAANQSLQADPDLVLTGKSYVITAPEVASAATPESQTVGGAATQP